MVNYSEITHLFPSISFFFARLGASFGFSGDHCPRVGDFIVMDSSLGLVLGDLYPLLRQSLDWFRTVLETLREERMGSGVRSNDLETGPSSSADTTRAETDTATSIPASS